MDEFNGYVGHFLQMPQMLIYLGLSLLLMFFMFFAIFVYVKITSLSMRGRQKRDYVCKRFHNLTERFYEIIFSGTSILLFIASYYLIERFYDVEPYKEIWNNYKDFLLLFLIVLSCIINSILDSVLIRLKSIDHTDKASGRLTGMLYMLLIFVYIKFIYENNNYDMFITYFLGLMIGRFVYFDASFKDFAHNFIAALKNIPLMLLGLSYTGIMCLYGFTSEYLIKHIGVVTDTCITHLFMCVSIFIVFHSHLADFLVGKLYHIDYEEHDEDEDDEYDEYE